MLKLPLLQKKKKNSEIEHVNAQSTEFHDTFDLVKQTEEIYKPYPANDSELCERLKKVLHG